MSNDSRIFGRVEAQKNFFSIRCEACLKYLKKRGNIGDFGRNPLGIMSKRESFSITNNGNIGRFEHPVDISGKHRLMRIEMRIRFSIFSQDGRLGKTSLKIHWNDGSLGSRIPKRGIHLPYLGNISFALLSIRDGIEILERLKIKRVHKGNVRLFVSEFVSELLYENPRM